MNTTLKTSEVLDLAADEVQRHGWVQGPGGWWGPNHPDRAGLGYCVEGALMGAMGCDWGQTEIEELATCPAYQAMVAYVGADQCVEFDGADPSLWIWNDSAPQSAEEVVIALRAAAAVERTREAVAVEVA